MHRPSASHMKVVAAARARMWGPLRPAAPASGAATCPRRTARANSTPSTTRWPVRIDCSPRIGRRRSFVGTWDRSIDLVSSPLLARGHAPCPLVALSRVRFVPRRRGTVDPAARGRLLLARPSAASARATGPSPGDGAWCVAVSCVCLSRVLRWFTSVSQGINRMT